MTNSEWKRFFLSCRDVLGEGSENAALSNSWCAWTCFRRLANDIMYWTSGIPNYDEILDNHIADGGVWGQPFSYSDLAHVIIPAKFLWERCYDGGYECGTKSQNIDELSLRLQKLNITHRKTDIILEIKLY